MINDHKDTSNLSKQTTMTCNFSLLYAENFGGVNFGNILLTTQMANKSLMASHFSELCIICQNFSLQYFSTYGMYMQDEFGSLFVGQII